MQRRVFFGGIYATVGFLLSPLSWWNDLVINIPLAYGMAWVISLAHRGAFEPVFVAAYWVTNVLGFFMMHKGLCKMVREDCSRADYLKTGLWKDLLVALFYTVLMILLLRWGVIQPLGEYLS